MATPFSRSAALSLWRRALAEGVGTALLLAVVVGSGIMGERLSNGNVASTLLVNSLATGLGLAALILGFESLSGAHFNSLVTVAEAGDGRLPWREVPAYVAAQVVGAFTGVAIAHGMFAEALFSPSRRPREGAGQFLGELVATFGLLTVLRGCSRRRPGAVPFAVGAYITAAYWFTSSTSFANPAVTLARSATDSFVGIRLADVPLFLSAQVLGALAAVGLTGKIWKEAESEESPRIPVRHGKFFNEKRRIEMIENDIRETVKEKYGKAALQVKEGQAACCGTAPSASNLCCDTITSNLYEGLETGALPETAVLASLGCGNPTALAKIEPGQVVLDLGSGGGIDVLLSAKRVGPTGKAYGLDMTDEMLDLARENQRKAGAENVEFLKGTIEEIPLPADSVDVVISNCVINLAADKDRVLREAFRVLKPGGKFAVSDVVTSGEVPAPIKKSVELWIGCVAGALAEEDYISKLAAAGFADVSVEPTRIYRIAEARDFLAGAGIDVDAIAPDLDGKFRSAFIRATKPAGA